MEGGRRRERCACVLQGPTDLLCCKGLWYVLTVGSTTISKDEYLNLFGSFLYVLMLRALYTSLFLQFSFVPYVGFTRLCLMCISLLNISFFFIPLFANICCIIRFGLIRWLLSRVYVP